MSGAVPHEHPQGPHPQGPHPARPVKAEAGQSFYGSMGERGGGREGVEGGEGSVGQWTGVCGVWPSCVCVQVGAWAVSGGGGR